MASSRVSGYSVYTFSHNAPVLWGIDLPVGRKVGISTSSYRNGVHTIEVYCGDSPDNDGFDAQYPVDVWAFGTGVSPSGNYGIQLFSTSGILTHDLALPNISFPVAVGEIGTSSQVPAGVGRPISVGTSPFVRIRYTNIDPDNESNGYYTTQTRNFVMRDSGNVVAYYEGTINKRTSPGFKPADNTISFPSTFFVSEGILLP